MPIAVTVTIYVYYIPVCSMQLTTYCPTHIYTLIIASGLSNESESYQQLFTPTDSTMVVSVTSRNLQDNAGLIFKVLVRNSLSETFYETGATTLCMSHYNDNYFLLSLLLAIVA